ncbi:ABC transporter substrate-binding protein [Aurantimonas sp. MSK8Z-1]|uniref:CmpA/NrtA family ABC transporter substrate-binding protein n=1 Tax=Mangrovibrevibacter kandeliae TaxID=2968473 RepID=UPI002118AF32|nr:CmpA/NrtA family ABC transporter substrate-binding protein [Aurantimonas sp. MSK8Z-1]MCW4115260.1 ABC transporter substrate-binding protein [Aurantimonas sp. MSK8Z-1]
MSMTLVRAGYIPLLDCAALVVAAERGFAEAEGLALKLTRETSWANIRDRTAIGHFDVAHMLGPMAIAASLGLGPLSTPIIAPVALGRGGNTVTVQMALFHEMQAAGFAEGPAAAGAALARVVAARRASGRPRLRFGVVHPHSSHNYDLRYWLAACGIDPVQDIATTVVPPPFMADALMADHIDGFCVGEPWGTVAVAAGAGRIVTTKAEIWPRSPEKVLGVSEAFAREHPDAAAGLVRAIVAAAAWCDDSANHGDLVALLSRADCLGVDQALLRPALEGELMLGGGETRWVEEFILYARHDANRPESAHALWLFQQMVRWGDAEDRPENRRRAVATYRPDLFDAALSHAPFAPTLGGPDLRNPAGSDPAEGPFDQTKR